MLFFLMVQDNVFVTVVASIQYLALVGKAFDAFYKLSNTREQIQSYVFDGKLPALLLCCSLVCNKINFIFFMTFLLVGVINRILLSRLAQGSNVFLAFWGGSYNYTLVSIKLRYNASIAL